MAIYGRALYRTWVIGLCCLLAPVAALADDDGPYVIIGAGPSVLRNACDNPWFPYVATMNPPSPCSEKNLAYRAAVGYQYTRMWGLEFSYGTFGYASSDGVVNYPTALGGPMNYSWQMRAMGLALHAVATVHMGEVMSLIGKVGVARVEYDEYIYGWDKNLVYPYTSYYLTPAIIEKRNTLALGGGVQFDVGPHGSIRLMAETFGRHNIYQQYGQSTKVMPMMATFNLMYRY